MDNNYDQPDEPDEPVAVNEHEYNLADSTPIEHRFDRIIGNQLLCTMHTGGCPVIHVKPTEVLVEKDGVLHLVDNAPR